MRYLLLERTYIENNIVLFEYTYSKNLAKYFAEPYFIEYEDLPATLPPSIATIPFVANFYPICWFLGAELIVPELDNVFFSSIQKVKFEFAKAYPEILVKNSNLIVQNLVKNEYPNHNSGMLFSGGVDALYTYTKLQNKELILLTTHGADIEIQNNEQWERIKNFNQQLSIINDNPKIFLRSNMRSFYTPKVESLIYYNTADWWTHIQHGLALTTLFAPLSEKYSIGKVFIGSTMDAENDKKFTWGSSKIDNYIAWGSTQVIHHGQEANRFQKMQFLVEELNKNGKSTPFRVCFHHLNNQLNCSRCTKCLRAIISLIFMGENPNNHGFEVPLKYESVEDFYKFLNHTIRTSVWNQAVYFYWIEILNFMRTTQNLPFIFENEHIERKYLLEIRKILEKLEKRPPTWRELRKGTKNAIRNFFFTMIGTWKKQE